MNAKQNLLRLSTLASAMGWTLWLTSTGGNALAGDYYVSPGGDDASSGSKTAPFATLQRARDAARNAPKPVTIHFASGTYYLPETLVLTAEDSGTTWEAGESETPVISGGVKLHLRWQPYKDGILQAKAPQDLVMEELFVNGQRQVLARYPNYDPHAQYFDGFAPDAISRQRSARWADPSGGYFHAMHPALWGGFAWRITGKDAGGGLTMEGGWQNNRGAAAHPRIRFVENIFEELDAPGEWYLNRKTHTLYFYPPAGLDLALATVEATRLATLVEFRGSQQKPVRAVALKGLTFRHAARTVMETREPVMRSDWAIYRGGAIFIQGAEDCLLEDLLLDQVGGNAIFVNNYNRRVTVRGCEIAKAGASGVVFLGDPKAARNPLSNFDRRQSLANIDRTPGPQTDNYPADCLVDDCLIHLTGRVEKQTAGVNIDLAQNITVRHCSIYDMPRAGLNIGDGCWGGHTIEGCDIFDTVKETGDHGSFNSWGRDRYWGLKGADMNDLRDREKLKDLPLLDAVKPTTLRNSRWRCDHGWDIDLDDGSSNYVICNNLLLNGGLKLREGFERRAVNNIIVNNSLHPHVWFLESGDVFRNNIVMGSYRPAAMNTKITWGKEVDYNVFTSGDNDRTAFASQGCDAHSIVAHVRFVDPEHGDFRVKEECKDVFAIGFRNFPMDQFGVTNPRLKARARTPEISPVGLSPSGRRKTKSGGPAAALASGVWLGATLRELEGMEFSAFGVSQEEGGVQLVHVPAGSAAAQAGLRKNDLIQEFNSRRVSRVEDLVAAYSAAGEGPVTVRFVREQKSDSLTIADVPFVLFETAAGAGRFTRIPLPAAPSGTVTANRKTANDPLFTLTDGKLAEGYGPIFPNGVIDGAYKMDLGSSRAVTAIDSWSCNALGRGRQTVRLFGSNAAADPRWNTDDSAVFTPLGTLDSKRVRMDKFLAGSLRARPGKTLGTFRWIVWKVIPHGEHEENTVFQELAVETAP